MIRKGEWVVITTKDPKVSNVNSFMEELHGMVLQIPNNPNSNFDMTGDNGNWYWSPSEHHLRLAEPHEIPAFEPNYEIY